MIDGVLKATATSAKTGSTCTANIGGVVTTVEVARDLSVASGDGLLVVRSGDTWYAIGRTKTAAPAAVPDPVNPAPQPSAPQRGKLVVSPVTTATYQSGPGWYHTDVRQGVYGGYANTIGCAFYGGKPRSLSGATVTRASVQVRRKSGGVYAAKTATLRLVSQATRPSGAPTLGSSATGPSLAVGKTNTGFVVPTSWAQAMVDGTAGGLAVYEADGDPYMVFAGRADWSPAWTMTIQWER